MSFDWSGKRVVVTGGAGFLGSFVQEGLRARGVPDDHVFVPLIEDYDLTEKDACAASTRTPSAARRST
jgi:GDP-L-fucose synthase